MKTNWPKNIGTAVRRVLADVPWFGPTVSAVLIASLINVLTSSLFEASAGIAWGFIGALVVLALGFMYFYNMSYNRWIRNLGPIADINPPAKYKGLVALFSRKETVCESIRFHSPILQHCWLIVTPEMQAIAGDVMAEFPHLRFSLLSISNLYDTQACYEIVRHIYLQGAGDVGLDAREIIADITGGTKPMTMGMIVAALEGGFAIEHVPTTYDSAGTPLRPLPPIEIRVQKS